MSNAPIYPEDLSLDNFFAVLDLGVEIRETLEMSVNEELSIPVYVDLKEYRDDRQKMSLSRRQMAMEYIQKAGCFTSLRQGRTKYPTGLNYYFTLERKAFDPFFKHLLKCERGLMEAQAMKQAATIASPTITAQEFVFDQGVLFRHGSAVVEKFPEDSHEYLLLMVAFKMPFGERIDNATHPLDCGWRTLYDTARRINDKVKERFAVDNFFKIEFKDKFIQRNAK